MIDTNFERAAEKSLIMPKNYFDRYREHLGGGMTCEAAFWATENELYETTGFRKYSNVGTFRHALAREASLNSAPRVSLLVADSAPNMYAVHQ